MSRRNHPKCSAMSYALDNEGVRHEVTGGIKFREGLYEEAVEHYQKALQIQLSKHGNLKIRGGHRSNVLQIYYKLATCYEEIAKQQNSLVKILFN